MIVVPFVDNKGTTGRAFLRDEKEAKLIIGQLRRRGYTILGQYNQ